MHWGCHLLRYSVSTLCCAVLCCAVLCCAVLCCAVLCCAVLCCAVLCCAVLCCISFPGVAFQCLHGVRSAAHISVTGPWPLARQQLRIEAEEIAELCRSWSAMVRSTSVAVKTLLQATATTIWPQLLTGMSPTCHHLPRYTHTGSMHTVDMQSAVHHRMTVMCSCVGRWHSCCLCLYSSRYSAAIVQLLPPSDCIFLAYRRLPAV